MNGYTESHRIKKIKKEEQGIYNNGNSSGNSEKNKNKNMMNTRTRNARTRRTGTRTYIHTRKSNLQSKVWG